MRIEPTIISTLQIVFGISLCFPIFAMALAWNNLITLPQQSFNLIIAAFVALYGLMNAISMILGALATSSDPAGEQDTTGVTP